MKREEYMILKDGWELNSRPIRMPYPPQSPLSEYDGEIGDELKYTCRFRVPDAWKGGRVLLHFGAVDQVAGVRINGTEIGSHEGGYLPFSFDITEYLKPVLSSPEAPTAFVCYDVWRAICLKSSLELLGYQVPDDISIIANFRSDDYPFYAQKTRFTSYQLRTRELWLEGLKMLFDMIENPDMIKQKEISLIPFFVPGETVKTLHE